MLQVSEDKPLGAHVTVRKLVHRILVYFFLIAGTVGKSSAHDQTITTGIILSLFMKFKN